MTETYKIRRTTSHVRSTSLPSISSNQTDSNIKDLIMKLNTVDNLKSASSICHTLCDILNLHINVNDSIQCPLNQQLLSLEQNRNGVENVLEGCLGLIDSFASTKDVICLMKESILEVRHCIRRNSLSEEKGVNAYMMSRKEIRKIATKGVKNLFKINSSCSNNNNVSILSMIGEVEAISLAKLKSILCYLSKSKANNGKSWSLVAKLMHSKNVSCNGVDDKNEIQRIDQVIFGFEPKTSSELVRELEVVELFLEEIEGCLESISRCLLKIRVSLLNVISSC